MIHGKRANILYTEHKFQLTIVAARKLLMYLMPQSSDRSSLGGFNEHKNARQKYFVDSLLLKCVIIFSLKRQIC